MNKFEQISSDGHQISLVGGDQGWDGGVLRFGGPQVSCLAGRGGGEWGVAVGLGQGCSSDLMSWGVPVQ